MEFGPRKHCMGNAGLYHALNFTGISRGAPWVRVIMSSGLCFWGFAGIKRSGVTRAWGLTSKPA
jgi:hypothetical protein